MNRWIFLGLTLYSLKTLASGAWYQEPKQIHVATRDSFNPEFVILKVGVFSNIGQLTLSPSITENTLNKLCSQSVESIAWITHRLSSNEALSEKSGITLGKNISKQLEKYCFSAIELDIEPLKKAEPWLEPFLKGVKNSLNPKIKLRLAVPVLSPQTIDGNLDLRFIELEVDIISLKHRTLCNFIHELRNFLS